MIASNWRRRRDIASAALLAFMLFAFWLGGIEFTERGPGLGMAILFSVGATLSCWTCPFWRYVDGERQA